MSVDTETVRKVARLARIAISDEEAETMRGELNTILDWVEQLNGVDITDVEPMTSVVQTDMKQRADAVTDGACPNDIVANAPAHQETFFLVPKVVE
ncbi:MAG: Asp-tRNA(Asn)/Glu-tRNA(Gln) amidotransferase subunit GatC [Pseudomonadota bacterium]